MLAGLGGALPRARIAYRSDVPLRSGLAGSTALVVALLRARSRGAARSRARRTCWPSARARSSGASSGVTCGFIDHYLAVFGGCQLRRLPRQDAGGARSASEPFATLEALEVPLPFVLAFTGKRHSSDSVHRPIRARWLAGEPAVLARDGAHVRRSAPPESARCCSATSRSSAG